MTMMRITKDMVGVVLGQMTNHGPFPDSIIQEMQGDPQGASAQALRHLDSFTHAHFAFYMPANYFIQNAAAGSWVALLIVLGAAILTKRIFDKAFWLFKFQRRSEGVYIVPNALNTFLLFEGCFALIWIVFITMQYLTYDRHRDSLQHHLGVFNLIIWWPLWIGAFFAGWGSFYTAPGALDKGPLSSSRLGRFVPRPLLVNIFCLGTPILLIISLIPSIVLTQRSLGRAIDIYDVFRKDILAAAASASPLVSRDTADMFLQRASDIWQMQTRTHYYMSIGYAIWPVWAGLFLLFYIPAGGYLAWLVFNQVRRQRALLIDLDRKQRETMKKEPREEDGPAPLVLANAAGPGQVPLLFQPLSSSQELGEEALTVVGEGEWPMHQQPRYQQPETKGQMQQQQQQQQQQQPPQQPFASPPVTPSTAVTNSDNSEGHEVFFPALKPEVQKRATRKVTQRNGTPASRYRYLRRCFVNLTVLYVSIVLAAAVYLAVSASLARYLYEMSIRGPEYITNLVYAVCLATAWCNVTFGTATFFAIFSRFLDPANAPYREDDSSSKGQGHKRSPFAFRAGTGGSKTLAGPSPHDKTRTLPAVPESVGQTIDSTLQSVSISRSAWDQQQQQAPDGKPRAKTMMSFRIMRDAGRSGALLLRPTGDQLASQASFGQPDSANVSTHGRPSADESGANTPRMAAKRKKSRTNRHRGVGDEASSSFIMEEYASQTSSARSYREGRTVYYPTPFGPMPAPAPPEPKPLPPERSPPRTPIRADMPGSPAGTSSPGSNESSEQHQRKHKSSKSLSKSRSSEHTEILGDLLLLQKKTRSPTGPSSAGSAVAASAASGGMPRTPSLSSNNVSPFLSTPPRKERSAWVAREWANQPGSSSHWSTLPQPPQPSSPTARSSSASLVTSPSLPSALGFNRATSTPHMRSSAPSPGEFHTPPSSQTELDPLSNVNQSSGPLAAGPALQQSGSDQDLTSPLPPMEMPSFHSARSESANWSPSMIKLSPRHSKRESLGEPAPPPANPIPAAPRQSVSVTPSSSWSPGAGGGLGLAHLRRGSSAQLNPAGHDNHAPTSRVSPQKPTVPFVALDLPPSQRRRDMGSKAATTSSPALDQSRPLPSLPSTSQTRSSLLPSSVLLDGVDLGGWKREDDVQVRSDDRVRSYSSEAGTPQSPPNRLSPGIFF